MSESAVGSRLLGRRSECAALDELIAAVRAGQSRALVLRGDAGVGKSALLDYLVDHSSRLRVVRTSGIESEMELVFAALHQLCAPFADHQEALPGPQRDALLTALGVREGDAPDRYLVGLAVLSLLTDVAEQRPLICVVDDAQWLDAASAQAMAFVARRLGAESVGLVFATRGATTERQLEGLPELLVPGLDDADARALLHAVVPGPLDERVLDRIVAETRGNPLALLELPRGRSPAELAGGFGLADNLTPDLRSDNLSPDGDGPALAGRIEQAFRERLAQLPPATCLLLLVAAAEPAGDPLLVWRAAAALGVDADAAGAATHAGLIEFGTQVRFRHPLVRSAVYGGADPARRRQVHRALAEVTDAETDADRRAWHLAHATSGLDDDVAAELERSAARARARGGLAADAAFRERAAELTADPVRRAQRVLAAAQSKHQAGAHESAVRLLATAEAGPLEDRDRARAQLLQAQIAFSRTRGRDAPPLLLDAARRLEKVDETLARETYLDAFAAAFSAGQLVERGDAAEVAAAVLAADWGPARRPCDLLLEGLALLTARGYRVGAEPLKVALRAFREQPVSEDEELRWLWLACHTARTLGDDAAWDELTARQVALARGTGALAVLPVALSDRLTVELFSGRLAIATSLAAEADAVVELTNSRLMLRGPIAIANWRGREAESAALTKQRREDAVRRGEGLWIVANDWGNALRCNGLGQYDEALAAAERAVEVPNALGLPLLLLAELIEAAVRSGRPQRAVAALERVGEIAESCGTDWALGTHAESAALCTDGPAAEALYREAIDRLSRLHPRGTSKLARVHLVYGEWLRRERRRVDAREQLRIAHDLLATMGMEGFAQRARRELLATGETVRKRTPETLGDLTPQELQIARMAADGQTNPEIGAQLFLSRRTVEWHLRKVFDKLGVTSRRELRSAVPGVGVAPA
ncbi:helix-turn-helix transcriptional regulator [Kribbella sp. CA-247076]|uniref:helix-turn-helix transcriptional regulator n=1 Tax=Kribbella sp. CA-247076 TaxID=3239941 RepID=UPI003D89FFB3